MLMYPVVLAIWIFSFFAGFFFPPFWILTLIPPVVGYAKWRYATGGLRQWRRTLLSSEENHKARKRQLPRGWHPHPRERRHVLRWWDGSEWTLYRFDIAQYRYLPPAKW